MPNNEEVVLNNYSDDSQIKKYINEVLAPKVFHDIPLNVLNTGHFSLVNEYMSQAIEQISFTSSFYYNESFITNAVLPDSIYSEAAIFNIGYSFATPASSNFLLELKIQDIFDNAVYNADTGLNEFILDKDTKINLPEGFVYSLDYDILIQYKDIKVPNIDSTVTAWNVQYINREGNVCATNKDVYITYRVTDIWLCLLVQANEYERQVHTVVNNMTNGIPNEDKVITCDNHIAGFDVKYIDSKGNETYLQRDHILAIHDDVTDNEPYIHYIMDNPQTIRFMWQLCGTKYFVPETNSSFEITIYTCHGKAANAPDYKNEIQPNVITASNKYSNNANVMKAAFVIGGCMGGTDIGSVETVRRETIEAYNTANVISTDHDIDEWFKTFFFKNVLYPFFFKRRDDPWGRIWSAYIALKGNDDYIYRTNTLHGKIPYNVLYNNSDNTISNNEIIIPPGWIWTYIKGDGHRYTVTPYTKGDSKTVETVKSLMNIGDKFIFANPFGIRIQKTPFAIGYFSPWVNQRVTATKIVKSSSINDNTSSIYHAYPIITDIKRTYKDDHYTITSYILPNNNNTKALPGNGSFVEYFRANVVPPQFVKQMWNYFKKPLDEYANIIPMLPLTKGNGYIPFNPEKTYLCIKSKNRISENKWLLEDMWIEDKTSLEEKEIYLPITSDGMYLYGTDEVWGDNGLSKGHEVYVTGDTLIDIYPTLSNTDNITFERIKTQNYYEMRLNEDAKVGTITKIVVGEATETDLTKYGEKSLTRIGRSYEPTVYINIYYSKEDDEGNPIEERVTYTIKNAANIYTPYKWDMNSPDGSYVFNMNNVGASGIILYADMKPSPETGSVDYYRLPFSELPLNDPMFYIHSDQLPLIKNNMRVLLHTMVNGSETGRVEMQPVSIDSDGSYIFETTLYPVTELIDIDNRIIMASIDNGGTSWKTVNGSAVSLDASDPQIKMTILMKLSDDNSDSEIEIGDEYTGFTIVDEYMLDDVDLIQELKEMRSVVNFGESSEPTDEQVSLYNNMYGYADYNDNDVYNLYYIKTYASNRRLGISGGYDDNYGNESFVFFQGKCPIVIDKLKTFITQFNDCMNGNVLPSGYNTIITELDKISHQIEREVDWNSLYELCIGYQDIIIEAFYPVNINGGTLEIQLMPFVEYSLMLSDRFEQFVSSFTQVHKAIEPVIMKRLEGNNYLDCKLIATYGLPHSYSSDIDYEIDNAFWPDLNIQIEFDVKLYNQSLATNTINELRVIVKSYFNRLTSIHTPIDAISMDNNIYISHVIQQMEAHDNVAYMKFKGWYTNEKNISNGNYMDANVQAIVQKWKKLEDFPKQELERYVPEMFVMEDDNIVINIIK